MIYVALLRGINVGGHNVIAMSALVKTFARLGFANVRTYIASGNVIFEAPRQSPRRLETMLEKALAKAHRYDATVVVRTRDEMLAVIRNVPRGWSKLDPARRYNVIFLRHTIDSKAILDGLDPDRAIETVSYAPGVLFWSASTSDLAQTAMAKLSASAIYKQVTVRTLNTVKKLAELVT